MAILLAAFPKLKPEKHTLKVWFRLVEDIEDTDFMEACLEFCRTNTEIYPGTNIMAKLRALTERSGERAEEAWIAVTEFAWYPGRNHEPLSARAEKSYRLIGGAKRLSTVQEKDEPFVRKEFIEIYNSLEERECAPALPEPRKTMEIHSGPSKVNELIGKTMGELGKGE